MKNKQLILGEFFLLFIVFPIFLCLPISIWIKIVFSLIGFAYVIKTLIREKYVFFKNDFFPFPKYLQRQILVIFPLLILATLYYLNTVAPESMFNVVKNKPMVWLVIFFVYSFLSVFPQEIIYRSFFFNRYKSLFPNSVFLVFINALVFSLGHLFFQNTLVLIITFLGGLIFGYTYLKTKSLRLVFIEHTLYGYWLFTVGMGDMLGFPGG